MYLKRIEVQGFKSFADKIELEFKQGITAIVGPNGSGKSNVSDALRWVMGEQSVKSLRGSKMEDVIFSGTAQRKQMGFAEVTLVIDNSDGLFNVDYSEVAITRRVFRSGESEYFINKSSCRLKDIHEMLMDTGLGRDGYSIIGQGKIDEVINSKSDERRQIFEEAAGISKYRHRKEEAARKLAGTEENLVRINDIIGELENQVGPLKNQSEKAKKFLALRDEMKILEVNLSVQGVERSRIALEEATSAFSDIASQEERARAEIERIDREIEDLYAQNTQNDRAAEFLTQKRQEQGEIQRACMSDIEVLKNKIENGDQNRERLESEIAALEEENRQIQKEIEEQSSQNSEIFEREAALRNEMNEMTARLEELEREASEESGNFTRIQAEIIDTMNDISDARLRAGNNSALRTSIEERSVAVNRELTDREASLSLSHDALAGVRAELERSDAEIAQKLSDKSLAESRIKTLGDALLKLESDREITAGILNEKSARLKMLSDMERDMEGYSRGVKVVLQAQSEGRLTGVRGTVAQLLTVPAEYSVAIENALGSAMQNIITNTEEDAKRAIQLLKNERVGRATFLPVSSVTRSPENPSGVDRCRGYIGLASDLVSAEEDFGDILSQLLGRTFVFDNIDNAIAAERTFNYRLRISTQGGELLAPGGSISGGSQKNADGFFVRSSEIQALEKRVGKLESQLGEIHNELGAHREKLGQAETEAQAIEAELQELRQENVRISEQISHRNENLEREREAASLLRAESERIEKQLEHIDLQKKELELQVTEMENQLARKRECAELISSGADAAADKRAELRNEQIKLHGELAELQKETALFDERTRGLRSREVTNLDGIGARRREIELAEENCALYREQINSALKRIQELDTELQSLADTTQRSVEARREAEEEIKEKQKLSREKQEFLIVIQKEAGRLEAKKAKAEAELEAIVNRLWDEYQITLTEAAEMRRDIGSYPEAAKRVRTLREQIRALGNINVDAIEEYKQVSERYEFLSGQRNDLIMAKEQLEQIISDMQSIMQKQFAEQFEVIRREFTAVFAELFLGGKAELRLSDPSSVLESGIEIEAQPPGKKLQNMQLLSGGEKALTAISLLLAIIKVRPTPFCVLDEIDTALDDSNVQRYAAYLKKYKEKTQFILITHKRGTMESADMLFGVTMREKGVSSLLALNLEEVAS